MTVVKETTIHRYIGLAADAKPTSVPAGSTFLAHDTDEIYITHDGGTTWVLKDALVRLVAGAANIGDVDVLTIAAGDNNIGNVDLASAIPAGTNNIGDVDVLTINGVAPQFDDTDKQAVSLYIKGTVAGDSTVLAESVTNPNVRAAIYFGANPLTLTNLDSDSRDPGGIYLAQVTAFMLAYSGSGTVFHRWRGNYEETALASAARTASVDSADLSNYNARGVVVVIDVTAIDATPSITVTIQGKSTLGSDYYTILASAAITGTGQTVLRVYPGLLAVANSVVNDVIPRLWRVSVAAGDADSITYSVSANYIL